MQYLDYFRNKSWFHGSNTLVMIIKKNMYIIIIIVYILVFVHKGSYMQ